MKDPSTLGSATLLGIQYSLEREVREVFCGKSASVDRIRAWLLRRVATVPELHESRFDLRVEVYRDPGNPDIVRCNVYRAPALVSLTVQVKEE